jgi:hypothetical protein
MNWELKETPKVGRQLAHWIWWAALAVVVLAVLALMTWKSIRRDHNLEEKKTGEVFRSQFNGCFPRTLTYLLGPGASKGSTT